MMKGTTITLAAKTFAPFVVLFQMFLTLGGPALGATTVACVYRTVLAEEASVCCWPHTPATSRHHVEVNANTCPFVMNVVTW